MAMGMDLMLKSMGVDVPDLMKKFEMFQQYVKSVEERLARLEAQSKKLDRILDILESSEIIEDGNSNDNGDAHNNQQPNA